MTAVLSLYTIQPGKKADAHKNFLKRSRLFCLRRNGGIEGRGHDAHGLAKDQAQILPEQRVSFFLTHVAEVDERVHIHAVGTKGVILVTAVTSSPSALLAVNWTALPVSVVVCR